MVMLPRLLALVPVIQMVVEAKRFAMLLRL
jgi:hypothetical protein